MMQNRAPTEPVAQLLKVHERPLEELKGRLTIGSAGRRDLALRRGSCRGRQRKLYDRWDGHESLMPRLHFGVGKFRANPLRRDELRAMPLRRDGSGVLRMSTQV